MIFVFALTAAEGQSRREALLEYRKRQQTAYTRYADNRRQACAEYMRRRWEAFTPQAPADVPARMEPDKPAVRPPRKDSLPTNDRMPLDRVTDLPAAPADDKPATPASPATPSASAPDVPTGRALKFTFYGTECSVSLPVSLKFRLGSAEESDAAAAWERLGNGGFDKAADECRQMKSALGLNDWGYYALVRSVSDAFCGSGSNESALMQFFLMSEAGYKVRLARSGNRLTVLFASADTIYARPFVTLGGSRFYAADAATHGGSYYICNFSAAGERALSMSMNRPPVLTHRTVRSSTHRTKDGAVAATVTVNANVTDFMNDYPACDWKTYASVRLSPRTESQLYPALRRAIGGRSEREAVGILLKYLHEGFDYMIDERQFGVERTFFAEEMFWYPYSDCEDRAILFARLVSDLLGLKVVLLHYPNHLAAAVRFGSDAAGDYVLAGSDKYTVCDPTYIGAGVGEAMPECKRQKAEVIHIN